MIKAFRLVLLISVLALFGFACSDGPDTLTKSSDQPSHLLAGKLTTPAGGTLQSATLSVYVASPENARVYVHRITDPWAEMGVTWDNFGGAFDATVEGSFMADGVGWRSVDVTSLVQSWMDGTIDNYGFLLRQPDAYVSLFNSSEWAVGAIRPKLELCFTTPDGPECEVIQRDLFGSVWDTYIWEINIFDNFGDRQYLMAGLLGGAEKHALIRFDMEARPPELASIGDYVWLDVNEDGIQDGNEIGYSGATVRLYDCTEVLIATTLTDADGYYLFDDLIPGDYHVEFVLPEGYVFSPQDQGGDDALDSDADMTTGVAICTTLDPGEHDPTWDAGIYLPVWRGCSLTIGFWKTHGGFGPQADVVTPLLPISLGSFEVSDGQIAHDVLSMNVYGRQSNGITKLMAQLLGTKLNAASGADTGALGDAIAEADQFLTDYSWEDWGSMSRRMKKHVIRMMSMFDDYNNGLIGPGHCGDDD